MAYQLGIDLGTATTSAAIRHDDRVETVRLDDGLLATPTVVAVDPDGRFVFGHDAAQIARRDPDRAAEDLLTRLGEPVTLAGVECRADELLARYLAWVVAEVTSHRFDRPTRIVVTYPARWNDARLSTFRSVVAAARVGDVELVPATVAAAVRYAARSKVPDHALVGVHDLGAGGLDVSVMRMVGQRVTVLAHDGSVEVSGSAVDRAIAERVAGMVGSAWTRALRRPDGHARAAALVAACREAKEALAHESSADIVVPLPSGARTVTLGRTELEAMTRPHLVAASSVFQRCLAAVDLEPRDLHRVVLLGAWSEAPVVGELLAELLGRPVGTDTDPRLAAAEGAATWNRRVMLPAGAEPDIVEALAATDTDTEAAHDLDLDAEPERASARLDTGLLDLDDGRHLGADTADGIDLRAEVDALLAAGDRSRRRRLLAGVGALAIAAAAGVATLVPRGDDPSGTVEVLGTVQSRPSSATPTVAAPTDAAPTEAITNAEWADAVAAGVVDAPLWWDGSTPPTGRENEPVDRVDAAQADAYCAAEDLEATVADDGTVTCDRP